MAENRFNLDLIDVPNPCPVPWDTMTGSDTVRHCGQCRKSVYHLSNMKRDEAERLLADKDGEVCVQFYRRADGTVVTQPCRVVGWWETVTTNVTLLALAVLAFFGLSRVFGSSNANSTFSFVSGGSIRPPAGGTSGGYSHYPSAPREVTPPTTPAEFGGTAPPPRAAGEKP